MSSKASSGECTNMKVVPNAVTELIDPTSYEESQLA